MNDFLKRDTRAIRALDAAANHLHRQAIIANDADERKVLQDVLREVQKVDSLAREFLVSNKSNSVIAGLSRVQTNVFKLTGIAMKAGGEAKYLPLGDLFYDIDGIISSVKRNDKKSAMNEAKAAIATVARIVKSIRKSISTS